MKKIMVLVFTQCLWVRVMTKISKNNLIICPCLSKILNFLRLNMLSNIINLALLKETYKIIIKEILSINLKKVKYLSIIYLRNNL